MFVTGKIESQNKNRLLREKLVSTRSLFEAAGKGIRDSYFVVAENCLRGGAAIEIDSLTQVVHSSC